MKTIPIVLRKSKVTTATLGTANNPWGINAAQFIQNLPRGPMVEKIEALADVVMKAKRRGGPVVLFLGGHPIKVGLGPFIVDLIGKEIVTALAVNGSVLVHDYEMSVHGVTSEDVKEALLEGKFGVTEETQAFIHSSAASTVHSGIGESVADRLIKTLVVMGKRPESSVLATAHQHNIPISAHVALGADVPHMDPRMVWSMWGGKLKADFELVCEVVDSLDEGGVALFLGSCTLLPEVFLKAVALNRNERGTPRNFTTGVFDLYKQYRLEENVIKRPTDTGYYILGPSEINFPIFCAMVKM